MRITSGITWREKRKSNYTRIALKGRQKVDDAQETDTHNSLRSRDKTKTVRELSLRKKSRSKFSLSFYG